MIRRTPADCYLRYRLASGRGMPVERLAEALADEHVFVPDVGHLERLRERMSIPAPFRPHDLRHGPSQRFVHEQGIASLFCRRPEAVEALAVFGSLRSRIAIETLITASADDVTIVRACGEHLGLPISPAALAEYRRLFWNTVMLTRQELAEYAQAAYGDREMARLALAPPGPTTVARAFAALGIPLPAVDERRMVEEQLSSVALLGAAYRTDMPPGPAQAAAIRQNAETITTLREIRAELRRGNSSWEESPYDVQTLDIPIPDLAALAEGRAVPYPLGLLSAAVDTEAGQKAGADGGTKPPPY